MLAFPEQLMTLCQCFVWTLKCREPVEKVLVLVLLVLVLVLMESLRFHGPAHMVHLHGRGHQRRAHLGSAALLLFGLPGGDGILPFLLLLCGMRKTRGA